MRTPEKKNTWHTRKQNLACLTCGQIGARTHTRHSREMIKCLRNNALNRSATGAAMIEMCLTRGLIDQGSASLGIGQAAVQAITPGLTKSFPLRKHAHAIHRKFFGCKNENFHWKKFDIFHIFAQNIDCGYTLEPPR